MSINMTIEGLEEVIKAVATLPAGIPGAIFVTMSAAMMEVRNDVAGYPDQRPPADPRRVYIRGVGTRYKGLKRTTTYRTSQRYGATTVYRVAREGNEVVGYVNSKATYSNWLRGTLKNPEDQAKQHANWDTLVEIVDRNVPRLEKRMEAAINEEMRRRGL